MTDNSTYSSEERLLATLAHASIVATPIGPIAGIFLYINQKRKISLRGWASDASGNLPTTWFARHHFGLGMLGRSIHNFLYPHHQQP